MDRAPRIETRSWAALAGALALWTFFAATKHSAALRPYSPFDVDPYDVVGSFTFQIAISVAALNLLRLHLVRRSGARERRPYVARGIILVAASIAVTMVSDTIAIVRSGVGRPRSAAEAVVWSAIGLLSAFAILLARGVDTKIGTSQPGMTGEFDGLFGREPLRAIDPQSHPVRFAALLSAGAAIAVTAAQIVGEGQAPTLRQTIAVIVVFLVAEATAVFVGFLSIGRWLGVAGPIGRTAR